MLKISNLYKYYNNKKTNEIKAVDGVSLELEGKGLVVLLGKSGCGKSTLLNVIGGLDTFDNGEITIDEETFKKYNSAKLDVLRNRKIGYVFQNYNLVPDMTVSENLKLSLDLSGIVDNQKERIDYALSLVGLQKYQNRYPMNLSGGQQQRVGIARAIVKNPEILIADEPTGNLDDTNTVAVMEILKGLSKHCLVLMVTHEESLADFYADRIIRLADGKIVSDEINNSVASLDHKSKDVIFLGDLERKEVTEGGLSLELYGEQNFPASIKLVSYENKLYLKIDTDRVVNIVDEDSSIRFTEEKYTVREKKDVDVDLNVEKLAAGERKKVHALDFKRSCKAVLNDYLATRGQRKRNRFRTMFLSALIFVLLIAVNAGSLVYNDFARRPNDSHVICINADSERVKALGLDGRILDKGENFYISITKDYAPFDMNLNLSDASNSAIIPASLVGKELNKGEVMVDSLLVERGLKNTTLDDLGIFCAEQLIGMRLDVDGRLLSQAYILEEEIKPTDYMGLTEPTYFTIVGIMDRGEPVVYVSDEDYEMWDKIEVQVYSDSNTLFYAKNVRSTLKKLSEKNIKAQEYNTFYKKQYYKLSLASNAIAILVVIILFVVQLIGSYKLTKSRFIANSRKFAVMRTIGVPKNEIMLNAFLETLSIFGVSSFKGWFFCSLVVFIADNMSIINKLENLLGMQVIYYPIWLAFACLGILAVFSILASLITPFMYLVKTPAKLISSYDIS